MKIIIRFSFFSIKKITGYGVVVNTSFNRHGRTMVMKPFKMRLFRFKVDFVCNQGICF